LIGDKKNMKANQKFRSLQGADDAIIFEMLIGAVFAVVIGYAALNIGVFINGTVSNALIATYPAAKASRSSIQNATFDNLVNNSEDLGMNSKMISTAYLITIITLPLMAVVMIKKFL
jgi:hypothetical protein